MVSMPKMYDDFTFGENWHNCFGYGDLGIVAIKIEVDIS